VKAEREDASDAILGWGGLRAVGNAPAAGQGDFSYWADAAMVMGNENSWAGRAYGRALRKDGLQSIYAGDLQFLTRRSAEPCRIDICLLWSIAGAPAQRSACARNRQRNHICS
jgi:hypothetical protein